MAIVCIPFIWFLTEEIVKQLLIFARLFNLNRTLVQKYMLKPLSKVYQLKVPSAGLPEEYGTVKDKKILFPT